MDNKQLEILLLLEDAISKLKNKTKKTPTEQQVYESLLLVREKLKHACEKGGLDLLVDFVKSIFQSINT